ncbi:hypothetical protein LJB42_002304 [Komagataella kurtzmanii]|nr:hypothetical protein LJB42_002304 [Komagataella kurtzmanii]
MSATNKEVVQAIISFLKSSSKDGSVSEDYVESVDMAIDCIADAFEVDKDVESAVKAKFGNKTLNELLGASSASSQQVPIHIPKEDEEIKQRAEAFKLEGNKAMSARDFETAVAKYTSAIELIPTNSVYLSNRAAAYSSLGKHESAIEDAQKSVDSDPSYVKAYSRLGLAKYVTGDIKGSVEAYKKGLDLEGENASETMKKGYNTAKQKLSEQIANQLQSTNAKGGDTEESTTKAANESTGPGSGGLPDLSSLLGGAGGAGGLAGLMNNPQLMQAAQSLMQNPSALQGLMSDPSIRQMAEKFGLGGGSAPKADGEGSADGEDSGSGPNLNDLMNNPMLQNLASQFMGGDKKP